MSRLYDMQIEISDVVPFTEEEKKAFWEAVNKEWLLSVSNEGYLCGGESENEGISLDNEKKS